VGGELMVFEQRPGGTLAAPPLVLEEDRKAAVMCI